MAVALFVFPSTILAQALSCDLSAPSLSGSIGTYFRDGRDVFIGQGTLNCISLGGDKMSRPVSIELEALRGPLGASPSYKVELSSSTFFLEDPCKAPPAWVLQTFARYENEEEFVNGKYHWKSYVYDWYSGPIISFSSEQKILTKALFSARMSLTVDCK